MKLLALGRAVRELRARVDVSQEELGFRAQMHRNHIGTVERGETNLSIVSLFHLLLALRVPLDEFARVWDRQYAALRVQAKQGLSASAALDSQRARSRSPKWSSGKMNA